MFFLGFVGSFVSWYSFLGKLYGIRYRRLEKGFLFFEVVNWVDLVLRKRYKRVNVG